MSCTIEMLDCHKVITNSDLTEGRGAPVSLGFFRNRLIAEAYAVDKGPMGTPAQIKLHRCLCVIANKGTWHRLGEEIRQEAPEDVKKVRERALAKLSPLEREALGLKR